MTQRNVRKQVWSFLLFSPDADDRLSLNFHRFLIFYFLYKGCDTQSVGLWTILFTESVQWLLVQLKRKKTLISHWGCRYCLNVCVNILR